MYKKIILAVATFALAVGAYLVLSSGDRYVEPEAATDATDAVKDFVTRQVETQTQTYTMPDGSIPIHTGDHTIARIYDDITGELKYQFEAKKWEPVSESELYLEDLLIQIFMPSGEITYVSCDKAEVTHSRKSGNRAEIRRGWLRGNVKVTIDRTTAEWRKDNPDLADRYAHPEDLINIDMEEAQFDIDQAELKSKGKLLVDSSDARIEDVEGLTLQWDQVNNKIDVLRFERGGKMTLRRGGGMIDFALPGTARDADADAGSEASVAGATATGPILPSKGKVAANVVGAKPTHGDDNARAMAMRPMKIETPSAQDAAQQIRIEGGVVTTNRPRSVVGPIGKRDPLSDEKQYELRSTEELAGAVEKVKTEAKTGTTSAPTDEATKSMLAEKKRRKRIHTYHAVFENAVVVEQKDGLRTLGRIDADKLEINFDFGEKQRSMSQPRRNEEQQDKVAAAPIDKPLVTPQDRDRTKVTLTWDGPLEMRPMQVAEAEQTGERFDAIATGSRVTVRSTAFSDKDGRQEAEAMCRQLVYRHERGQVWLLGTDDDPVRLTVDQEKKETRQRVRGREIFFDQKRGLAVVEGPGLMADDPKADTVLEDVKAVASRWGLNVGAKAAKRGEAVQIRWTRGVDLELGRQTVMAVDPSTKLMVPKNREFLKRAWFHGDASVQRGDQFAAADELAVTFGYTEGQSGGGGFAVGRNQSIRHLNMVGDVELRRDGEHITAQRLDVEMDEQGRNQPKVVDGEGNVRILQPTREFRAQKMHVVMTEIMGTTATDTSRENVAILGDSRLGIDSVDAKGDVFINDEETKLHISEADSLVALLRNGNELIRANIDGESEDRLARARYEDFEVHGQHIAINMDQQAIDVPGPGELWMRTDKDFGGSKLDRPTLVKTSWTERMEFRLAGNYGHFYGDVRSESGGPEKEDVADGRLGEMLAWDAAESLGVLCIRFVSPTMRDVLAAHAARGLSRYADVVRDSRGDTQRFALDCRKLTVKFEPTPAAPVRADANAPSVLARAGRLLGLTSPRRSASASTLSSGRKRPSFILADGDAVAISSRHANGADAGENGRLISRFMIQGNQISVDLLRSQMSVPGKGDLLVEDYQFDVAGGRKLAEATVNQGPLMSSLRSDGASQTSISWQNGMDYFVDRSLVSFDQNVVMEHRSGRQMVMKEDIAESMQVDVEALQQLGEGRRARLTCGTLILEFLRSGDAQSGIPMARATDLRRLIAEHAVLLEDDTKSLMGEYLQYLNETDEVRLEGSSNLDARIMDQDEATQRQTMWRGPLLIWNRGTNQIDAPKAKIESRRQ